MLANFIESNPLPVKAVLAMMGKIEEVYRLPMLPMRRDTRSKLQKIAADAGLISKPATAAAEAADFYVYENWLAGPHKIVLHRSGCGQCNHGKGRPRGTTPTTPAGTAPTQPFPRPARPRSTCRACSFGASASASNCRSRICRFPIVEAALVPSIRNLKSAI